MRRTRCGMCTAVLGAAADAPVGLQLNVNGASIATDHCRVATVSNTVDGQYTGPAASGRAGDAVRALRWRDRSRSDLTVIIRL